MEIWKDQDVYKVEDDDSILTEIKVYRNPYHMRNLYVKLDLHQVAKFKDTKIFQSISHQEGSPLQVMISSLEKDKIKFLKAQGFKKMRSCYEMEVSRADLNHIKFEQVVCLKKAEKGQKMYQDLCHNLFTTYQRLHEAINPLTASLDDFINLLPRHVIYQENESGIQYFAFIEKNEIAYVGSNRPCHLSNLEAFLSCLLHNLFETYPILSFEVDAHDGIAMTLKNLFGVEKEETWDTWILEDTNESSNFLSSDEFIIEERGGSSG